MVSEPGFSPLRQEISLEAVVANTRLLVERAAPAELMAVVKADAYNHGAVECARAALAGGAAALGVATVGEALRLRDAGITAEILAWLWPPDDRMAVRRAVESGVDLAVPSLAHARAVCAQRIPARATVKVDTGMHRNGVDLEDLPVVLRELMAAPQVTVTGLMSHLACADDPADPTTDRQARVFREAIDCAEGLGLRGLKNHLSNSPALLTRPDLRFERVRPGIALFGVEPIPGEDHGLTPAMTWISSVATVRRLDAGEGVSYSLSWRAPRSTTVAVIPGGYADGIPRSYQGALEVAIGGRRYPQVGRVCMDQFLVDLGENPEGIRPGDEVRIVGPGTGGELTVEELGARAGTIGYEVLCQPRGRTRRIFTDGETWCATAEETRDFGAWLAGQVSAGDVVVLSGPVGAGKTTLTQGFARGLGVAGRVSSPTFTIAREHPSECGGPALIHVDAYRLLGEDLGGDPRGCREEGLNGRGGGSGEGLAPAAPVDPVAELDSLDLDSVLEESVVVMEWGAGLGQAVGETWWQVRLDRTRATLADPNSEARFISWSRRSGRAGE